MRATARIPALLLAVAVVLAGASCAKSVPHGSADSTGTQAAGRAGDQIRCAARHVRWASAYASGVPMSIRNSGMR